MATSSLYGTSSESTGLYGIGAASGGTYFEWFIFQDSATAPATPTGGSWDFNANTGTAPTGWVIVPPAAPTNQVWVSIAIVDSRNTSALTWSTPGLMTGSGLPILTAAGAPSSGTGLNGQLYINTSTTPQSMYLKESGSWVQLTGSTLYATAGANTNITSLTGITGGISSATYLQLNTAGDGATAAGKMQWDTTWNGPQIGMGGGNVNLQVGQETLIYVYNNTGSALTDGQVVYCTGSQGQRLTVGLALANADATSAAILGVVTEPIANNSSGFVTTQGMVNGLNTNGFADGAVIYLSPTTAGAWTTTKPQAPQHLVQVGYVVKGGSSGAGSIYVNTQNGYELDELHDVRITSVANGNYLKYDSAVPAWVNVSGPTGTLVGTTDTQTLTNKTISGASNTLTNIGNSSLSNSSVTINGNAVSLGGATTVTANTPNNLVFGSGLSSTGNFNGSTATTVTLANVGTAGTYGDSGTIPVITTNSYGQISNVSLQSVQVDSSDILGTIAIAQGGTGASSVTNARINLLPSYLGNQGKVLAVNTAGSDVEWLAAGGVGTVTSVASGDGLTGGPITAAGTLSVDSTVVRTTGNFTLAGNITLSSANVTLSSANTNSVVYTNGSSALTTGSVLKFNGAVLALNGSSSAWNSIRSPIEAGKFSFVGGTTGDFGELLTNVYYDNSNQYIRTSSTTALRYQMSSGIHKWSTAASGAAGASASFTDLMLLDASGNLGIGTTSPAAKLEVSATSSARVLTVATGAAGTTNGAYYDLKGAATTAGTAWYRAVRGLDESNILRWAIGQFGAPEDTIAFYTGTSAIERMRLDASGDLGLGVTPTNVAGSRKLEVGGTTNSAVVLSTNSANASARNWATASNFNAFGDLVFLQSNALGGDPVSAGTTRMTLNASGNLGIGTTSPSQKLTVAVADTSQALQLRGATGYLRVRPYQDATNGAIIDSTNAAESAYGVLTLQGSTVRLFGNNGTGATIDTSGNLGLGVAPSAWTLPAFQSNYGIFTGSAEVNINANTYYNGSWRYINSTVASRYSQFAGAHAWYTATSGTAGNAVTFTQAMTLDASGRLVIGSTTPATASVLTLRESATNSGALSLINRNNTQTWLMAVDAASVDDKSLAFIDSTGSAVRMTLDSSGNLGLGVTPSGWATNSKAFQVGRSGVLQYTADNAQIQVGNNYYQTGLNAYTYIRNAYAGHYSFSDFDGVHRWMSAPSGTAGNAISFTQAMTLDASGNLMVGQTSAGEADNNGFWVYKVGGKFGQNHVTGTGSGTAYASFAYAGTQIGSITQSGTAAVAYNTSSDYRLKENIQPMTGALAKVAQLKPVTYTWKADGSAGEGFIAHELAEVCPQAVTGEKDAVDAEGKPQYQGIDVSFLVGTLTAAIQELKAEFDAYKATHP